MAQPSLQEVLLCIQQLSLDCKARFDAQSEQLQRLTDLVLGKSLSPGPTYLEAERNSDAERAMSQSEKPPLGQQPSFPPASDAPEVLPPAEEPDGEDLGKDEEAGAPEQSLEEESESLAEPALKDGQESTTEATEKDTAVVARPPPTKPFMTITWTSPPPAAMLRGLNEPWKMLPSEQVPGQALLRRESRLRLPMEVLAPPATRVLFQLSNAGTDYGETIGVVGEHSLLGGWSTEAMCELRTTEQSYPQWQSKEFVMGFQEPLSLRYKYVRDGRSRGRGILWEDGISDRVAVFPRALPPGRAWLVCDAAFNQGGGPVITDIPWNEADAVSPKIAEVLSPKRILARAGL